MAKRKAARRKGASARKSAGRSRSAAKKVARRKAGAAKKAARKRPRVVARKASRAKATRATRPRAIARAKKSPARKPATRAAKPKASAAPKPKAIRPPARTAPGLNRERRVVRDDDIVPSPPSSLDFDRSASAARSGRRELRERYEEHTETGPAMTGGDVDADWESAYSVGDEAPGGDSPTPDQDLVDDIGRAVGIEYQDNEELKGEAKIAKRDRNRWELDPASSDDWDER
jgi:hypothetical protein